MCAGTRLRRWWGRESLGRRGNGRGGCGRNGGGGMRRSLGCRLAFGGRGGGGWRRRGGVGRGVGVGVRMGMGRRRMRRMWIWRVRMADRVVAGQAGFESELDITEHRTRIPDFVARTRNSKYTK
ncbi:hypothetical protein BDW22DRAFT_618573 [Trametopsis cervina]|nr:hypothetical protein BDW22DRAFT_618573 [Trametopsis cervina]